MINDAEKRRRIGLRPISSNWIYRPQAQLLENFGMLTSLTNPGSNREKLSGPTVVLYVSMLIRTKYITCINYWPNSINYEKEGFGVVAQLST